MVESPFQLNSRILRNTSGGKRFFNSSKLVFFHRVVETQKRINDFSKNKTKTFGQKCNYLILTFKVYCLLI